MRRSRVHCDVRILTEGCSLGLRDKHLWLGAESSSQEFTASQTWSLQHPRLHAVTPLASPLNISCLERAFCDWSGSHTKCFCSVWFCRTQQLSAGVAASVIWQLLIATETQTRATLCSWHPQLCGKKQKFFCLELNIYLFYATIVVQLADIQGFLVLWRGRDPP